MAKKIIQDTTRKMSQLCRKIVKVDVRWGVLKRVSFVGHFFRFIWNRLLVCSVAGRPSQYRKLPLRDPSSTPPSYADDVFSSSATTTGGYDSDSDLVNLKISLLGDCHIGKTTFVIKYVGNEQEKRSLQMEGLNLMDKTLSVQGARISFRIWDVAGDKRSLDQIPMACKDSVAILIMFDLTSRCTLNSVVGWYSEARKWNQTAIPILIGTKFDDFVRLPPDVQWTIVTQEMSSSDAEVVRIKLFFNGTKIQGGRGVVFEGEQRMTRMKRNATLSDLHQKIHPKLGVDRNCCITLLTARIWQQDEYMGFPIQDDEELEMVIEEYFNQARKKFLELYVDYTVVEEAVLPRRVEEAVLPRRSVVLPRSAASYDGAASYDAAGANMSQEDSHDPTWVMDDDEDDDDDENIAMEDRLLQENASASDNDEDVGVDANAFRQHTNAGSSEIRNRAGVPPTQSEQPVEGGAVVPFWDEIPHYTYIDWNYPSEESSFGGSASGSGSVQGPWQIGDDLYVEQEFPSKKEAQIAVKRNLMREHQEAFVVESKPDKFAMKCVAHTDGCPWRVRVMKPMYGEKWVVSRWGGKHNCLNNRLSQDHRQLDVDIIVSLVVGMIKEEPGVSIALVQERISTSFGFKVSYCKAWYAKQKAMAMIYGDWEESYAFLPRWCNYMLRFSPGSFFDIQTNDYFVANRLVRGKRVFQRMFWTFRQCCEAFKFCKPVIQIDGTHLYGKYKGKLLIATSQDGNNECLPLAFAIVEGETLEAWEYFLANIRFHVTQMQNICLISDRHRSIISAVQNHAGWQPPFAHHVFCLRHIASNFNQRFKSARLKKSLIALGYNPSMTEFDIAYERFRDTSAEVAEWIDSIPKEKWTRAYDVEGRRYGHMTTNLSESVNKVFKGARNMPITALVKHTYSRLVEYFVRRGQTATSQMQQSQLHCKNVVDAMRHNQNVATGHHVQSYNLEETSFEVADGWDRSYSVNLTERFCQCGKFKTFKYPCSHAAAAALYIRQNPLQYVDHVFLLSNLVEAYSLPWQPIGDELAIPPTEDAVIIPDRAMLRAKGRPRSTRIHNEMDEVETGQRARRCGLCKQVGHTRTACPTRGGGVS